MNNEKFCGEKICKSCQVDWCKQYPEKKRFDLSCNLIKVENISKEILMQFPENQRKIAETSMDIIKWAGFMFKNPNPDNLSKPLHLQEAWMPRVSGVIDPEQFPEYTHLSNLPYQEAMLRCTAKLRVSRTGRRTGKTTCMAIDMLFHCYTSRTRCLVIAPRKSHVDDIFTRIRQFIKMRPELQNSVVRDVSSPFFELQFANGSRIRGFTSGASSGADAITSRGQDADKIYLDEADYLSDGDLTSIIPIVFTHKDVTLWASSTPRGNRSTFWSWCTQNPSFKQFHFPSLVIPEWKFIAPEMEDLYRGRKADWEHEVLAEFGEEKAGVYENVLVQAAKSEYDYNDCKPEPGYRYIVGVDWNSSNIGTEIYIIGYSPATMSIKVVANLCVSKKGWTQLAALQTLADINRKWKPDWIYVDRGYGNTQIEFLKKFGYENIPKDRYDPNYQTKIIDARMKDIVKGIDFGSKIKIRDPFTGREIEKPMKPYLVNNSVRLFEERRLTFSYNDLILERQLLGYRVGRYTDTGRPVYEQGDETAGDHKLDALNLALLAVTQEYTSLGKPMSVTDIVFTPSFGKSENPSDPKNISQHKALVDKKDAQKPQPRTQQLNQQPILGNRGLPAVNTFANNKNKLNIWGHKDFLNERSDGQSPRNYANKHYKGRNTTSSMSRGRNAPKRSKF